jgi:hypothetical protein
MRCRLPNLTINSNLDAQVLLIGNDLKELARAVGSLTINVKMGIYKAKAERGGGINEQILELTGDKTLDLRVSQFPAVAPIAGLLNGADGQINAMATRAMAMDWSDASQAPGWEAWFAASQSDQQATPGLLVVAHKARGDGDCPMSGLSLQRWESDASLKLDARALQIEADKETWSALWVPANPGCYVIEIEDGKQKVRQAVYVAPNGWQTRIFLRRRSWISGSPSQSPNATAAPARCHWFDVSIQMAHRDDPLVCDADQASAEVARNALELSRSYIATNALIENLLNEKFNNPLAGITGLHLFLSEIERQRQVEGSATLTKTVTTPFNEDQQKTIKWALENLERLLIDPAKPDIRPPSDLIAVKLRARAAFATSIAVRDPPMLWASWDALRRLSNAVPNVNFARELWNKLAWSAAWGPYLAWPPQGSNVEDYLKKQAPTLPANLANSPPAQSAFRGFVALLTPSSHARSSGLNLTLGALV